MNLNEFVNKYELVLRALARISIPDWRMIARVEHNVQFAERFCLKRFVLTAVNKSHSTEFDVTLDTWVKHTLEMFDDNRGHNYEVLVGVNVTDLKGAQPLQLVEIAYKSSDGLLLVGNKQDDFQTLDEWLEVVIDSITQIKVRL